MHYVDPVSLYIATKPNDKARLKPLIRIVVNMIVRLLTAAGNIYYARQKELIWLLKAAERRELVWIIPRSTRAQTRESLEFVPQIRTNHPSFLNPISEINRSSPVLILGKPAVSGQTN